MVGRPAVEVDLEQPRIFVIQKKPGFFYHRNLYRVKVWAKVPHLCWKFENSKSIQKSCFLVGPHIFFSHRKWKGTPLLMQVWNQDMFCFHWKGCDFQVGESFFWGEANLLKSEKFLSRWSWPKNTSPKKPLQFWWTSKNPNLHIYYKKIDRKRTYKFVAHPDVVFSSVFWSFRNRNKSLLAFFRDFRTELFKGDIHRKPLFPPAKEHKKKKKTFMLTQMNLKLMILRGGYHSDHESPNKNYKHIKYQTFTHDELKDVITKIWALSKFVPWDR